MKTKYYAGIGSRETPKNILDLMRRSAIKLRRQGYTLRSGGAKGADTWFKLGALHENIDVPPSVIYTPKSDIPFWAMASVDKYHPNHHALTPYARMLHARNAMILLGSDQTTPVDFVICWTKGGADKGGTGQALRIAKDKGIPIYNLFSDRIRLSFERELENI
jgi:hypothetical protein